MALHHVKRMINTKIEGTLQRLMAPSTSSVEESRQAALGLYLSILKIIIDSCEEETSHELRH